MSIVIARKFAEAFKVNVNKNKLTHKMLIASTSMRFNGTDKIYQFEDISELQVRDLTGDWQVFQ
jgi:hypothetical protein